MKTINKLFITILSIIVFISSPIQTAAMTTHYSVGSYTDSLGKEIILRPVDVYKVNNMNYIDAMAVSHLDITFAFTSEINGYIEVAMPYDKDTTKRWVWNTLNPGALNERIIKYSKPFVDHDTIQTQLSDKQITTKYKFISGNGTIYVPLEFLMEKMHMSYDPYKENLEAYSETYNSVLKACPYMTVLIYPNEYYYTQSAESSTTTEYKSEAELREEVNKVTAIPGTGTHKEVKMVCDKCIVYGVVIKYINDEYAKVAWYKITDKQGKEISEFDYPTYMNDAYKFGFRIDASTIIEINRLS